MLLVRTNFRLRFIVCLALAVFVLLGVTGEAHADKRPFHLNVFFGMSAAGQLFRAENPDSDYNWQPPNGDPSFKAESIRVDLDENVMFGFRFGKGLSQQFSVNFSASFTTMNATAIALTESRNSDTYKWDSMNANFLDAVVVWDWTPQTTTPYFVAGLGYASLGFEKRENPDYDLDQSGIQYILGAGLRWNILQFEVRDHIVPVDLSPEERRLNVPIFEDKDLLHLWEITIAFTLNFGKTG